MVTKNWTTDMLKGSGRKGMLSSGAKRFQSGTLSGAQSIGPGSYETKGSIKVDKRNRKKVFVSREQRFHSHSKVDRTPGPGSYDSEFLYGNMNKRTFNMTIAEQEAM